MAKATHLLKRIERQGDGCCVGGPLLSTTLLPPPIGPPIGRGRWGGPTVPGRPCCRRGASRSWRGDSPASFITWVGGFLTVAHVVPKRLLVVRELKSSKQINRLVRTFLWRRVTEQALRGSSFVNIPDEINQAYIGDLLRIGEAFAAPLSNLFAFVKSGHPACPFIAHTQLALYASPRFWQYGLLAFIARCCSFDNQHRHQDPGTAQAEEGKSQTTKEKDVDALTFMRTVIMFFVRGMEHGEQTLPTNDLFVYLPVQILPDLVVAMERQGFTPAEVKGGYGYRPKEEDAEDNPLLWECTLKTLFTTGTPECRILPGQKEPTLVVPLTRLWDKLSRSLPFCS